MRYFHLVFTLPKSIADIAQARNSGPLTVDVAGMKVLGGFEDTDVIGAPFETATMIGYEPDYMFA